jgi:hypothetical protein
MKLAVAGSRNEMELRMRLEIKNLFAGQTGLRNSVRVRAVSLSAPL